MVPMDIIQLIQHGSLWGLLFGGTFCAAILITGRINPEMLINDYPPDIRAEAGPMSSGARKQVSLASIPLLLALMIANAAQRLAAGAKPIVVMIHYPPFLDRKPTQFAWRIAAGAAAACVYGHLHRPQDWSMATQGNVDGVYYQLTSCDYLGFGPIAVRGLDRKPANQEGSIGDVYD